MSTLRDYFGISDRPDNYWARDLYWNVVTNRFYIRNVGFEPLNSHQCVLLGKYD